MAQARAVPRTSGNVNGLSSRARPAEEDTIRAGRRVCAGHHRAPPPPDSVGGEVRRMSGLAGYSPFRLFNSGWSRK